MSPQDFVKMYTLHTHLMEGRKQWQSQMHLPLHCKVSNPELRLSHLILLVSVLWESLSVSFIRRARHSLSVAGTEIYVMIQKVLMLQRILSLFIEFTFGTAENQNDKAIHFSLHFLASIQIPASQLVESDTSGKHFRHFVLWTKVQQCVSQKNTGFACLLLTFPEQTPTPEYKGLTQYPTQQSQRV